MRPIAFAPSLAFVSLTNSLLPTAILSVHFASRWFNPFSKSSSTQLRLLKRNRLVIFARTKIYCNAKMSSRHIRTHCKIDDSSRRLLESAIDKLGLSARAFNRVLKIARTIADLEVSQDIQVDHISEAIQYRNLDRGSQFK